MKRFSKSWKASKKPKKQRKYVANAPLHIKRKFLAAHLSKELIKKYNRRSIPLRKGDTVKILRGNFKKQIGKIEKVNLKRTKVFIENIQQIKRDGTKAYYPLHPSNLLITSLNLDDKKRKQILERTKK